LARSEERRKEGNLIKPPGRARAGFGIDVLKNQTPVWWEGFANCGWSEGEAVYWESKKERVRVVKELTIAPSGQVRSEYLGKI
jgi:hypothetical protein